MKFIFLVLFLSLQSIYAKEFRFGENESDFKKIRLSGTSIIKQKNQNSKIELSRRKQIPSELFLDFENKQSKDLKDRSNHYTIQESSYRIESSDEKLFGKRVARFTGKNHFITIQADKNTLVGSDSLTEDFYISFFIKPEIFQGINTLFAKTYYSQGKKYSLSFTITKNKIVLGIENLFTYKSKQSKSLFLESHKTLDNRNWTNVVVYFQISQNEVIIYENGVESNRLKFPLQNDEEPQFGMNQYDTTPLIIGKNYYGMLDNFLIAKGDPNFDSITKNYYGVEYDNTHSVAFQKDGKVISEIFKTKYSKSFPVSLQPNWTVPEGSSANLFIRFSEKLFSENDDQPEWVSFEKLQKISKNPFQYFQWKVSLRSDFSGNKTPTLNSIYLHYRETTPPVSPTGLVISGKNDRELKVCLKWDSNKEKNVKTGGGYILHYGLSPERMIGSISINENKDKISSTQLCIDNHLIELNSDFKKEKNLPVLQNGKTYYFKVSAYNDQFNQSEGFDQKSPLSKPPVLVSFEADPAD